MKKLTYYFTSSSWYNNFILLSILNDFAWKLEGHFVFLGKMQNIKMAAASDHGSPLSLNQWQYRVKKWLKNPKPIEITYTKICDLYTAR